MKKIVKTLLLVIWLTLIYYLSSQTGTVSGGLSTRLLRSIGIFIRVSDIDKFVSLFGTLIRKMAHLSEYFILFILSKECFKEYGVVNTLIALVFCVICATCDEVHQLFVDGRSGQLLDILIDSFGAFLSFILCRLINKNE